MEREESLNCIARVALAIQASGQEDVHWDFIEIIKELPEDLRQPATESHYPAFTTSGLRADGHNSDRKLVHDQTHL